MWYQSAMLRLALVAIAVVCASCSGGETSDSPDARRSTYCDQSTPCRDEVLNYCDLMGQYPASNGVANTCIPDPALTECSATQECSDPAQPHCSGSGRCVECLNYSHCNGDKPRCSLSENVCSGCRVGDDGNQLCATVDPLQPFCSPTGACSECLQDSDCDVVTQPICDGESFACRGCQEGECAEGSLCNTESGVCENL